MTSTTISSRRDKIGPESELLRGAATMVPLMLGYAPFALIVGATVAEHVNPAAGWAGTWLIFGGSAHLAVMELVDGGASVAVALATGLLINARLLVYSASLAPNYANAGTAAKLFAAACVIDPTWAVATERNGRPGTASDKRSFYAGAALVTLFGWLAMVTAGVFIGAAVDPRIGLEVVVPICLAFLLAPALKNRPGILAVSVAGLVALLAAGLPSGIGFLVAIASGAAAGALAEGAEK